MMADLLGINGAAINKSLKSLSKNRIEWFLNVKVKNAVGKCKGNTLFESFNGVAGTCFSLDEFWS